VVYKCGVVLSQWEKSPKKQCIIDNMALYFEFRINKNALLQTGFIRAQAIDLTVKFFLLVRMSR